MHEILKGDKECKESTSFVAPNLDFAVLIFL